MNSIRLIAVTICMILASINVFAQEAEIGPTEVFQYANKILRQLNDIAEEMGNNTIVGTDISVSNVSPREVYFQAASLYEKTSQLMFEFTSKKGDEIVQLMPNATPAEVMNLLLGIEIHLQAVAKRLDINKTYNVANFHSDKRSKDIFILIVNLNRKTNSLLDYKFTPAESFQKVTESIALASAILQTYPNATAVFSPSKLQRKKTPSDVYHRIARVYMRMTPLMDALNKSCLVLGAEEQYRQNISQSDVHDLAVLITSQLHFVHSLKPLAPKPKNSYYPGKVVGSDVYQRLSILEKQIDEFLQIYNIKSI